MAEAERQALGAQSARILAVATDYFERAMMASQRGNHREATVARLAHSMCAAANSNILDSLNKPVRTAKRR